MYGIPIPFLKSYVKLKKIKPYDIDFIYSEQCLVSELVWKTNLKLIFKKITYTKCYFFFFSFNISI